MDKENEVALIFEGGLATEGMLHFYEYSRSVYGFARLIATVEHFRRTGQVAKRVGKLSYVAAIIKAPEKGSFPIEVLVPLAADIAKYFSEVPIKVLVAYITNVLSGLGKKDKDRAEKIAEAFVEVERQRTAQSREETKRFQAFAETIQDSNATNRELLAFISHVVESTHSSVQRSGVEIEDARELQRKLEGIVEREEIVEENAEQLEAIGEDKLLRLAAKTRPQIEEIGKPLARSASTLSIGIRGEKAIAVFTRDDVESISAREIDDEPIDTPIRISAFDRDMSNGKADLQALELYRVSFRLPLRGRDILKPQIISALNKDAVMARILCFKDVTGSITSIMIMGILDSG